MDDGELDGLPGKRFLMEMSSVREETERRNVYETNAVRASGMPPDPKRACQADRRVRRGPR
jgi:hypothetical protein